MTDEQPTRFTPLDADGNPAGESIDIPSGTGWRLTGPEGELIAESIPLTPEHHAAAEAAYARLRGAGVLELPASLTDTYQLGTNAAATLLQLAGAAIEAENEQALQGVWDEPTDPHLPITRSGSRSKPSPVLATAAHFITEPDE